MVNINIANMVKYGIATAFVLAVFGAVDILHLYYVKRKNHIAKRPIHEVVFVMSNGLPCCGHTEDRNIVQNCRNPFCKAKLSHKIIDHINEAKHLICIAMYMFTMRQFYEAVLRAHQRGIKVRMIADRSMIATSGTRVNQLQESGIPVRIAGDGDRLMHNKFLLIDILDNESNAHENTHPQKGILINGSMNWTANGLDRNWENIQFTSDDIFKSEYKKAFDHIWSRIV